MNDVPTVCSHVSDEAVSFAIDVVDASHVATRLEALLVQPTGRPRTLPLRAVLVALVLLALDDRALHLKAATRTLYSLAPRWRDELGVHGEVHDEVSLLARYRCVRYLFHRMLSVMDPSTQVKNRVVAQGVLDAMAITMDESEIAVRRQRLEGVVNDLLEASVAVCAPEELAGFDGSIGLDATVVPLIARGPSSRAGTCSSDPDGGWYVREGDHRDVVGPKGKKLRKLFWAQEATIVTMGRSPGSAPTYPNLVLAALLTRPGEDPGASAVRLLGSLRARGYRAGFVGADRGYTQVRPERFHLAARALGYRVVMDYKESELGRQANSDGAVLVEPLLLPSHARGPGRGQRRLATRGHRRRDPRRAPGGKSVLAPTPQADLGPRRLRALLLSRSRGSPALCTARRFGRPQPRRDPGPAPSRATRQGVHTVVDHHRPRRGGSLSPGAGLRIAAVGAHLRHLPQHR